MTNRITFVLKLLILFLVSLSLFNELYANSDEDPQEPTIWSVSFEGNDQFSSTVLRNIIAAERPNVFRKLFRKYDDYRFSQAEMQRDRIRIMRFYQRRGFSDVDVELEITEGNKEWKKNVLFRISERKPIRISNTNVVIDADSVTVSEIESNSDFNRTKNRHDYTTGNRYQTIRLPDVKGMFDQTLQNNGYPWPEIDVISTVDSLNKTADVEIRIQPNSKSYFDSIELEGVESVPDRIVLQEMDIKQGDVFDQRKLQEAQRQIFGHHLFRFATVTVPEQPQDSTIDLRVRVRENPLRSLQATIGFGNEELLRGQLSWQHRNITGTGHRLGFSGRGSFIEQRLSADYLIPYVFNTRSSFVASPFGQRRLEPSYELLRVGITNSLIYQVRRNFTASATYEFTINEEIVRRDDAALPDSMLDYNVSSLTFSSYYRQGFTRDPVGWVIQPAAEFSGLFGESTFSFQKFSLDVRNYQPVTSSTTVAARINIGTIFYADQDSLPANIQFFTGGTNTVRGWSRQQLGPKRAAFDDNGNFDGFVPIGGRALFSFNTEIRQELNFLFNGFGIAAFLDGGQVWRAPDRINERRIQFGAGSGLRYQSPIGPVRVDFAYKLNPFSDDLNQYQGVDHGSAWDRIAIHFSIGQAF